MGEVFIPRHYSTKLDADLRRDPPNVGGEREVLTAFLDWHRVTFELKCDGVPPGRLAERAVPPSTLSLHGLARHLACVERWWFAQQFAGLDLPMLHYSDEDPDQDFEFADADPAADLDLWRAECRRSRDIAAAAPSLDATGTVRRTGEAICLRTILVKMIAEYGRHLGHADLLRERIDGAVGQ